MAPSALLEARIHYCHVTHPLSIRYFPPLCITFISLIYSYKAYRLNATSNCLWPEPCRIPVDDIVDCAPPPFLGKTLGYQTVISCQFTICVCLFLNMVLKHEVVFCRSFLFWTKTWPRFRGVSYILQCSSNAVDSVSKKLTKERRNNLFSTNMLVGLGYVLKLENVEMAKSLLREVTTFKHCWIVSNCWNR